MNIPRKINPPQKNNNCFLCFIRSKTKNETVSKTHPGTTPQKFPNSSQKVPHQFQTSTETNPKHVPHKFPNSSKQRANQVPHKSTNKTVSKQVPHKFQTSSKEVASKHKTVSISEGAIQVVSTNFICLCSRRASFRRTHWGIGRLSLIEAR